jgi:hypothetical protein
LDSKETIVRIYKRSLGLALAAAALAAVALFVVFGNTDIAIMVAAAATLVGMFFLRRYARIRLIYDNDSAPAGEVSIPASRRRGPPADEGTIADLAERMRGRFN